MNSPLLFSDRLPPITDGTPGLAIVKVFAPFTVTFPPRLVVVAPPPTLSVSLPRPRLTELVPPTVRPAVMSPRLTVLTPTPPVTDRLPPTGPSRFSTRALELARLTVRLPGRP